MSRPAVLRDFPAEGWPSMDLAADQLLAHWPAADVCPPFVRAFARLPHPAAFNADRLLNRFVVYPMHLRRVRSKFDTFHVADHSYAHLVHSLPAARTGVFCHDLDTFRCLLRPHDEPRPWWFRALARRILTGLQKAAVVFHSTLAVRARIEAAGLLDPARLVHAPYGVAAEFMPTGSAEVPWLDALAGRPWVLHVGSCIPRKRIDVLLDAMAAARRRVPGLALVKVGGEWTTAQREQIDRLKLDVVHVAGLSRTELAEAYRRAGAVLLTSDAEGFGLPVLEALACGTAVIASDLPAVREAGGPAAVYCPMGNGEAFADAVVRIGELAPPRQERLRWAGRFTWQAHADTIAAAYRRLG